MIEEIYISGFSSYSNLGLIDHNSSLDLEVLDKCNNKKFTTLPPYAEQAHVKKKSDANSMGPGQLLLAYATGNLLETLGVLAESVDLKNKFDIYVSTRGGERNESVDSSIFKANLEDNLDINVELQKLRPVHFLTELPNLFAANLSILYDFLGESITFMGEDVASVNSVNSSIEKISSGRSDYVLNASVFNGDTGIHREFSELNSHQNMYRDVCFGSASTSILFSKKNAAITDPIASLTKCGDIKIDNIAQLIDSHGIDTVSISHSTRMTSDLLVYLNNNVENVFNINEYIGNVFESALQIQIILSYLFCKNRSAKILILCETFRDRFSGYILNIQQK